MCQNIKFATEFIVEPLLSNHVERVTFCLDDRKFVKQNDTGLFKDIYFIFYKDIYVFLLALGGYVCMSISYRVFHSGRLVGN